VDWLNDKSATASSPTRNRTRTSSFEARYDLRFTIEPRHLVISPVDLMGVEPITPILQGSVAPNGMEAQAILDFRLRILDCRNKSKIGNPKSKIE
jgi:hypothetical protein